MSGNLATATEVGRLGARTAVWILSPFSEVCDAHTSDRYRYLCEQVSARGIPVCQFVSAFDHARKARRGAVAVPWRCVQVYEPGYRRNVSLARVLSHVVFDLVVGFYLLREAFRGGRPSTVFIAIPHNGAALVAVLFARLVGARAIVDVHDTWPESILSVTTVNPAKRLVFRIWKGCADLALRAADHVFAESVRYAERGDAPRKPRGLSPARAIYLGGDLSYYDAAPSDSAWPAAVKDAAFLVAYVGSLGVNYDLDCVLDAFGVFQRRWPDAALVLLGAGEREEALRRRIAAEGLRAWVSGRIPHPLLVGYLKRCAVGLNAFKGGGNVAYSYKLNDYLLSGVPVVNSLTGETADLIREAQLGANYDPGDPESLLAALEACRERWRVEPVWRERVLAFAARTLDRRMTYRPMIDACIGASGLDTELTGDAPGL